MIRCWHGLLCIKLPVSEKLNKIHLFHLQKLLIKKNYAISYYFFVFGSRTAENFEFKVCYAFIISISLIHIKLMHIIILTESWKHQDDGEYVPMLGNCPVY